MRSIEPQKRRKALQYRLLKIYNWAVKLVESKIQRTLMTLIQSTVDENLLKMCQFNNGFRASRTSRSLPFKKQTDNSV